MTTRHMNATESEKRKQMEIPGLKKAAAEWAAKTPEQRAEEAAKRDAEAAATLPEGVKPGEEFIVLREDDILGVVEG
ncbi:hypothetical protein ACIQF6_00550 [Kitasatospora sp. NPDC092948]|uniref:hypothetical protein n=1 Tax=Kitasatospora sp. NPDC092948 TaxID=3364088 RepID=UPI0037F4C98E